ncbi:MAG: hypothetical protein Kow0097_02630 [Candidatus Bipolaricaulota bacterium]
MRRWARIRNGVRAGLAGTVAVLAAILVGRGVGTVLPAGVWLAVPVLAASGGAWPLTWDRVLLRAGRRLGVGERLAALAVLARRGTPAFREPLLAEIESVGRQPWRLVAGPAEIVASALSCGLALAVGLLPAREPPPPPAASAIGPALVVEIAPPGPEAEEFERPSAVPSFPALADLPGYSPYPDLLAAVLGLEDGFADGLSEEEVIARLATEEGLLRRLVERIAAAAPEGISPSERAELAPLAEGVARQDLRERVEELLDQGDEGAAAEAVQAVEAVLEAAERAGEGQGPAAGGGPSAPSFPPDVAIEGLEPELLPQGAGARGAVEDAGLVAGEPVDAPGTSGGEPLEAGPEGGWGSLPAEAERVPTAGGEGPLRSYLVPAIPGEPPSTAQAPSVLTPQEVEVVLRARGIPLELRDLVRHYFELIGGNP